MEKENDNLVPEITAANPDGGAERLDADKISEDVHNSLDALLDEAERETSPETEQPTNTSNEENTDTNLESLGEESSQLPVEEPSEPATEPAPESVNAVQPESVRESQSEIDPEIAAIEQPRNLSEKNQNNWRKLQETATSYKKQAEETAILRQRLEEAEQRTTQTPQDYEELKKFKQIFDIKNDPEFQSKYTQPISAAKENIYNIMRKHGATDEVIQSIEKAGGPDKIEDKWWQENALAKLPMTDAEKLKRNLIDVSDLKDKQEAEVAYAAEHAEEILAQRQQQSQEWYQQETGNIRNYVDEITKEVPWARYQEIPETATQEQVEKIQAHNNVVADLENKFNSALWPQSANERASVAAAAVYSHVLTNQLRAEQSNRATLESQLKKLTEENSRLKSSGKMPRQSVSTPSTNKITSLNERIAMKPSDAIDMGLDEAGE
jgi:hypothetical protein